MWLEHTVPNHTKHISVEQHNSSNHKRNPAGVAQSCVGEYFLSNLEHVFPFWTMA
jgi:hypothetical protein